MFSSLLRSLSKRPGLILQRALRRRRKRALLGVHRTIATLLRQRLSLTNNVWRPSQVEAALAMARTAEMRLVEAIDLLPEGIVILDSDRRYVAWNRQYKSIYEATADYLKVGGKLEDAVRAGLARGEYPEALGREEQWLAERLERLSKAGPRHEQTLADGRCILIEDRPTSDGGLVSLRIDITEMKQREASFRLLFESNPVPMFVCERGTWAIKAANDAAVNHYGYTRQVVSQMSFADIHCAVDPHALVAYNEAADDPFGGQSFKHVRLDGSVIAVELFGRSLVHDGAAAILVAAIDVTDRKRTEFRVSHMARHDALTGLPNRVLLSERMQRTLVDVEAGETAALLFLDLDKFKTVNDTLGHAAGDMLLSEVAKRLQRCVRAHDTVARLGGDEFAILLTGGCTPAAVARTCARILKELQIPIAVKGREIAAGVSIGIAMAPYDATTSEELFRCSDLAMYSAKDHGRGVYKFFQKGMDEKVQARNVLELELARAITDGALDVYYQPLVSLETGKITCMEALVRWRHPDRGLIPPSEFIPVAEENGMIVALGEHVLRRACRDASSWPSHIKVAVNVSALELESQKICSRILSALEDADLPPGRLQVEVTETAVMSNMAHSLALLKEMQALGVEIAMDDFGTGHSSLSFLRSFAFNKIKIDRAFITDSSQAADGRAILAAIVSLARTLGMSTTAEGVETLDQYEIVKALGCTDVQGYLFSAPKPLCELTGLLQSVSLTAKTAA